MRIVFMGSPDFSVPVLDALIAAGHEIACVYCQPPRPAGRGKKERLTSVHMQAEKLNLDVRVPLNFKKAEDVTAFTELNADVAVVVAYGLILPQAVLDAPMHGCLNIHASLLPRWRGAAPIHRAIMAGDDKTGVCIMQMEAGLDTGPVLMRQEIDILNTDTTGDLHYRLSKLGADAVVETLSKLNELVPNAQPEVGVTYASKISKEEARIDWTRPAVEVDRHIRGLSPFPGAWCDAGERLKLLRSSVCDGSGVQGAVLDGFKVACGSGAIQVHQAQREGKRAMAVDELLKGWSPPEKLA